MYINDSIHIYLLCMIKIWVRWCNVGLIGIVRNLIQKSTWMDTPFLSIFPFRMSRASNNSKAAMKKQNMVNPLGFLSCTSMTFYFLQDKQG